MTIAFLLTKAERFFYTTVQKFGVIYSFILLSKDALNWLKVTVKTFTLYIFYIF